MRLRRRLKITNEDLSRLRADHPLSAFAFMFVWVSLPLVTLTLRDALDLSWLEALAVAALEGLIFGAAFFWWAGRHVREMRE